MPQKKEPKKSEEEKAAEKVAKANQSLLKACKNDERSKVEDAVAKGADINFINEKGHSVAHVAAAFGALDVIRYLYKSGADFTVQNAAKKTPLESALQIGEADAAKLIEALLSGQSGDDIGKSADDELLDIGDGSGDDDEAAATDRSSKQKPEKAAAAKAGKEKPKEEEKTVEEKKADAAPADTAATPVVASPGA